MSLTAGSKLFRSRSEIFAFCSGPKAEIEDNVHPQFKGSAANIPEHGLDEAVSDVVFWLFSILTKEAHMPLIWC